MSKNDAGKVLAANLKRLMEHTPGLESGPKLHKKSKVAQKTISNVLAGRHDTQLSTIEKLAHAFGFEAHQLLMPITDETLLRIVNAYNTSGEDGRRLLALAAETAGNKERDERRSGFAGTPEHTGESATASVPKLHARIPK